MYERFTDRARRVLQLANQNAQRLRHECLGTEHVLLGLLDEGAGVAANVLKNLGADVAGRLRAAVVKAVGEGPPDRVVVGKLPHTPEVRKALEQAVVEARCLGHNYVGTEHLLLGLLAGGGGAALALGGSGLDARAVREEILCLLGRGKAEAPPSVRVVTTAAPTPPHYRCVATEATVGHDGRLSWSATYEPVAQPSPPQDALEAAVAAALAERDRQWHETLCGVPEVPATPEGVQAHLHRLHDLMNQDAREYAALQAAQQAGPFGPRDVAAALARRDREWIEAIGGDEFTMATPEYAWQHVQSLMGTCIIAGYLRAAFLCDNAEKRWPDDPAAHAVLRSMAQEIREAGRGF